MRGVIYARYSSDSQQETSIEGQLEVNYKYAKDHNIIIVKEYIDRAITGRTDRRPAFLQMIEDARSKNFDCVIVYALDRFARDPAMHTVYELQLNKYNVSLLSATQELINKATPESILVKEFFKGLAGYYSANLSQAVSRGISIQKRKCKYTGGLVPLGYTINADKDYVIDPTTSRYVDSIFELYLSGSSLTDIIKYLNDNNVLTSNKKPFTSPQSIVHILRNEKYIGVFRWKDFIKEDGIPAIIDKFRFSKVQEMLDSNMRGPVNKNSYLLSGKIFYNDFENPIVGSAGTSHTGKKYKYYICRKNKKIKYPKDKLENYVLEATKIHILHPDVLNHIAIKVADIYEKTRNNDLLIKSLKKQLSKVESSINGLLKALEAGIVTNSTKIRLESLEAQKQEIQAQIDKESIKMPPVPLEYIEFYFSNILEECKNAKKIIELFINSIIVTDETITIYFNCTKYNKVRTNLNMVDHAYICTNPTISIYADLTFALTIPNILNIKY